MSISATVQNSLPLASSIEILSGVWIPSTPLAVWMDLAPPLSKYGDPRILAHSSDYSHPRTSQAARSLRDDGGPIGPNAPSEVPMQDAPSGHLADADPTLVVAPIPLSPRTPRTCYVPGFAHGRMELVGPPGHAEMVGIGAHLASDDASRRRPEDPAWHPVCSAGLVKILTQTWFWAVGLGLNPDKTAAAEEKFSKKARERPNGARNERENGPDTRLLTFSAGFLPLGLSYS
ncbi:hypothetical protein C8R44DRAFT_901437 [Mycena epipterygia]|nr:hypothetical protein C8R44DRAFT_901437 [Mycena epipterygia]